MTKRSNYSSLLTPFRWLLPHYCPLCEGQSFSYICPDCTHAFTPLVSTCSHCDLPIESAAGLSATLCPECTSHPPSFDSAVCAFEYDTLSAQAIYQFKEKGDLHFGRYLTWALLNQLKLKYRDQALPEALIPVPLHWRTQLNRRFNQSHEIASWLSKELKIPVLQPLHKKHAKKAQKSLSKKAREVNTLNSIALNSTKLPAHVAIIDDVITTGATANGIAKLLKGHGVKRVEIWALARTPKFSSQ